MPANSKIDVISQEFKMIYDRLPATSEKSSRGIAFARDFLVPQNPESWMQFEDKDGRSIICTKTPTDRNEILVVNDSGLFVVITGEGDQSIFQALEKSLNPLTKSMEEAAKSPAMMKQNTSTEGGFTHVFQVDPEGANKYLTLSVVSIVLETSEKVTS